MLRTLALLTMCCSLVNFAAHEVQGARGKAYDDPANVDDDYALQGEYVGSFKKSGKKFGMQVIALGGGKFRLVSYEGGLPGDGWDQTEEKKQFEAQAKDGAIVFKNDYGTGTLKDGVIKVQDKDGNTAAEFKKVNRKSSTLGAKPPKGAIVLFDGSSPDNFKGGKMTKDGLLMQGVTSKQTFGDHTVHMEFRLPYMPQARGQGRGNSGYYVQGRYEIQMLDSFGLEGKDNECGGIYKIAKPKVNMCYPPLTWQTYDVDFTAAKYENGKKIKNAHMTIKHNGVVIHENLELPHVTGGKLLPENEKPGPIFLQNHGNPVRYRNMWVVEKK